MHKLSENQKITYGGASTALGGEASDVLTTPAFVDMENYDIVEAVALATLVGSGKILTLAL